MCLSATGDDWLNITPDELERLLEERGGQRSSKGQGVTCRAGSSEDEEKQQEEEAGYTLVAVTQGMKDFINAMSSHEGAEFPRYQHHRSLTLRENGFIFIFTLIQCALFSGETISL